MRREAQQPLGVREDGGPVGTGNVGRDPQPFQARTIGLPRAQSPGCGESNQRLLGAAPVQVDVCQPEVGSRIVGPQANRLPIGSDGGGALAPGSALIALAQEVKIRRAGRMQCENECCCKEHQD